MSAIRQQVLSASVLAYVRQVEVGFGVATIRSLDMSKRGPIVRPFSPNGTLARRHKITDRAARKAQARRWTPANPVMRLTPHKHASAQKVPAPNKEPRFIVEGMSVVDRATGLVIHSYTAVKTANRRARQLNQAA